MLMKRGSLGGSYVTSARYRYCSAGDVSMSLWKHLADVHVPSSHHQQLMTCQCRRPTKRPILSFSKLSRLVAMEELCNAHPQLRLNAPNVQG
jgi:hypothetical protein